MQLGEISPVELVHALYESISQSSFTTLADSYDRLKRLQPKLNHDHERQLCTAALSCIELELQGGATHAA